MRLIRDNSLLYRVTISTCHRYYRVCSTGEIFIPDVFELLKRNCQQYIYTKLQCGRRHYNCPCTKGYCTYLHSKLAFTLLVNLMYQNTNTSIVSALSSNTGKCHGNTHSFIITNNYQSRAHITSKMKAFASELQDIGEDRFQCCPSRKG